MAAHWAAGPYRAAIHFANEEFQNNMAIKAATNPGGGQMKLTQKQLAKAITASGSKNSRHLVALLVQLEKKTKGKVSNLIESAARRPVKK